MFAIVETGGKQYKVAPNNTIRVEKLDGDEGSKIILDKVLLIQKEDGNVVIGQPLVSGAKVEATINRTFKDDKVIDFHKRRRKNSRRKNGHRQTLTELKIVGIIN
ncbi:MAG: 50S ribosomal protein L21 [Rickettsiales bacterium]|jgi:large subunit ribosomal protein L21|nr:50S ribosomal protein L21 [Rickettsiales bacterium]